MRYRIMLLSLAMLAACGDDGPEVAEISEMRVVKVSGDQSAQVPPPEIAGALRITATVGEDGWTDEPLIARIVTTGGGGAQATITGVSADVVPTGTLVHWYLPEECGRLFAQTTATDDSAYTVNRWAPGTKAGTCEAQAGRLVGTQIVMDATWELEVLPGPPVQLDIEPDTIIFAVGDTVTIPWRYLDEYGNPVGSCDWPPLFRSLHPKIEVLDYNHGVITAADLVMGVVRALAQVGPGKCARNGQHYDQVVVITYF